MACLKESSASYLVTTWRLLKSMLRFILWRETGAGVGTKTGGLL